MDDDYIEYFYPFKSLSILTVKRAIHMELWSSEFSNNWIFDSGLEKVSSICNSHGLTLIYFLGDLRIFGSNFHS